MADVFVSYARQDRDRVAQMVQQLSDRGVSVFWDQSVLPGSSWTDSIKEHLESSKAIIVVWSQYSIDSDWAKSEADYALSQKKLVPVRFDSNVVPPLGHRSVAWVNLGDDIDRDVAPFERLLTALRHLTVIVRDESGRDKQDRLADDTQPKNRGFAFISHVEEDTPIVSNISSFLKTRGYAYWTYLESDRDYQKPTVLEIEERMLECALMLTVISPDWKRSEWTQRELAFAREIKKPLFHLRFRHPGPTLAIAGDTYFDFERGETDAFTRLGIELDKKGL